MAKFKLLRALLEEQGLAREEQIHTPLPVPRRSLELIHSRRYHQAFARGELLPAEQRRIGLPATTPLVQRTWLAVGGSLLTARLALQHGVACHLAGGTHHAYPDHGSGFCIFNDFAVAAQVLLAEGQVQRLMIIDLDVHQGDATASIFRDEPRVFTLSVHCGSNFPLRKQQSDVDLALDDGLGDDAYLESIGDLIPTLLDQEQPDLVLYNAGVDPHREDRLGRLNLTDQGLLNRDRLVLDSCLRRNIPVATVIGGGYDALTPLVLRHGLVFRAASEQARLHGL
jgi:acetoin utilization deacetylase AcuC-like enzyme